MGVNAIMTLKRANLILICKSASENTVKQVEKIARGFHCEVLKTKNKLLEEFTFRPNNKAMAITDKSLADAIKKDFSEDFIL